MRTLPRRTAGFSLLEISLSIVVFSLVTGSVVSLLDVLTSGSREVVENLESLHGLRSVDGAISADLWGVDAWRVDNLGVPLCEIKSSGTILCIRRPILQPVTGGGLVEAFSADIEYEVINDSLIRRESGVATVVQPRTRSASFSLSSDGIIRLGIVFIQGEATVTENLQFMARG